MLAEYITERYPQYAHMVEEYARSCHIQGIKMTQFPYGFFSWKAQGDAIILYDMYVLEQLRLKGYAWALFNDVKRLAKRYGKHVIITFNEKEGHKQELGLSAIKAAGFTMAFETADDITWIRGVN